MSTVLMCFTNALGLFDINWQMPYAGALFLTFLAFVVIGYLVLWYFWRGKNWARWLVMLECLQCFWNLRYIGNRSPHRPTIEAPMILSEAAIAVFLIVYLNLPHVRIWFRLSSRHPEAV